MDESKMSKIFDDVEKRLNNNVKCWIYFQGSSRNLAKNIKKELIANKINTLIDENFRYIFPNINTIEECVLKSMELLQKNNGIAIIIFSKTFFQDGRKEF